MTAKQQVLQLVQDQRDDSSYDEILRELVFARMIERGIEDATRGRTISHEEMMEKISR
jgi:predicted transcriptional regulator